MAITPMQKKASVAKRSQECSAQDLHLLELHLGVGPLTKILSRYL